MTVLLNVSRSFLIVSQRFSTFLSAAGAKMAPQARNFGDCYRVTAFLNVSQSFLIVSHMLPRGDNLASPVLSTSVVCDGQDTLAVVDPTIT